MGVRGLTTFLERDKRCYKINISFQIEFWMRKHPNESPIIVFDFMSFTHNVMKPEDIFCGGRHAIALKKFDDFLELWKETGATLVFFSDLNVQHSKIYEWISRRNEEFISYVDFYDRINAGDSLRCICESNLGSRNFALSSLHFSLKVIASKYGAFIHSTENECDLEMARFATENNVFAVVTSDSDFLIFKGNWKFWSAKDLKIDKNHQILTTEYDRNAISKLFGISEEQKPIFATLVGNGYMAEFYQKLTNFHRRLGNMRCTDNSKVITKFHKVANYVRQQSIRITDETLQRISIDVFGISDEKFITLIKESISSYDINYETKVSSDQFVAKLLGTGIHEHYVIYTKDVQGIITVFNDFRGRAYNPSLPKLLIGWTKRKAGILRYHKRDSTFSLIILAQISFEEKCVVMNEMPIYPDFPVPPLDELYLIADDAEIRWKLLAWIFSLDNTYISTVKAVPKEFLLISTTLFVLVKEGYCSIDEADAILLTEYMERTDEETVKNTDYLMVLHEDHIRLAHIYNTTFGHVRSGFAIAGLWSKISALFKFDGVYFQHLMSTSQRKRVPSECEALRPYQYIV